MSVLRVRRSRSEVVDVLGMNTSSIGYLFCTIMLAGLLRLVVLILLLILLLILMLLLLLLLLLLLQKLLLLWFPFMWKLPIRLRGSYLLCVVTYHRSCQHHTQRSNKVLKRTCVQVRDSGVQAVPPTSTRHLI